MRLEIFNAEFNSLCNIAPDLLNPFFEQKAQAPEENPNKVKRSKSSGQLSADKKNVFPVPTKKDGPLLGKRQNSNDLFDNEIIVEAEFKKKKPETLVVDQIDKFEETKSILQNEYVNPSSPVKASMETQVDSADFIHPPQQEQKVQNDMGTQSGELPDEKAQECQTVVQQSLAQPGKTIFIQPIYIYNSNQQVGYFEVDIMDENSLKQISMFLQNK